MIPKPIKYEVSVPCFWIMNLYMTAPTSAPSIPMKATAVSVSIQKMMDGIYTPYGTPPITIEATAARSSTSSLKGITQLNAGMLIIVVVVRMLLLRESFKYELIECDVC
jgi:hypothetical protein